MQESYFQLSRRGFIGAVGAAGAGSVSVLYHDLAQASKPAVAPLAAARSHLGEHAHEASVPGWSGVPGQARYRIEGMRKVTGQKTYARDFRAKDMLGWPQAERLAMVLRASITDQPLIGLNLSMLGADSLPMQVIVQKAMPVQPSGLSIAALDTLNLSLPFSSQGPNCTAPAADCKSPPECTPAELLTPIGTSALFYGQPVAILIFADLNTYRRAKRALQFNPAVVQYGAKVPLPALAAVPVPYNPVNYLTRYDASGSPPFSQVQIGAETNPNLPDSCTPQNGAAKSLRSAIDASLANPSYRNFSGTYSTQVLDPMFMEPEAGLAWLDASQSTMHLVLGTQATNGDVGDIHALFSKTLIANRLPLKNVSLYSCFPGGGFGGRDVSTFPPLLAIAAAFSDQPVRIAQDRYEQFQSGLKQLASKITHSLAVDANGQFVAFKSQQTLLAGGNNNYSQFVAMLTAYCGHSGYNIKQAYVDAVAQPTRGVVAGSMRGFGGPQASFAVETLVDEAAVGLGRDPIDLREKNALKQFDRTITGAPLTQPMTLVDICRRAKANPLWVNREKIKAEKAKQGIWYGVGFALANQAFGTGTDGVMAEVSISAAGELTVRTNCVDMGNGSATTLAISTAGFAGNNATHIKMGDVATFLQLQMNQNSGGKWSDASWTPSFSMSSSACLTAFHQVHVTSQATQVLFQAGLLPAAAALWKVPMAQVQGKTLWSNGLLTAPSMAMPLPALSLAQIATQLQSMKLPDAAMVHGLYQGSWVGASYPFTAGLQFLPIDGLALRNAGSPKWQVIPRQNVIPPDPKAAFYGRSLFAPSGALVAVEIPMTTGKPKVVDLDLVVDAGKVLQRDLLIGQAQGGIAMGIGYALLENLPLEAGGAGEGNWNLDRYHVALASDMPTRLNITTLPSTETTAKGIAEAVLCPIAPAIGNAIAHATGKRFRSLPITAQQIKGA